MSALTFFTETLVRGKALGEHPGPHTIYTARLHLDRHHFLGLRHGKLDDFRIVTRAGRYTRSFSA